MFKRFFLSADDSICRKNYIWNIIAGGVNAAEAVVLMAIVARVINDEAAGILTIAFAVGNLLMNIGKFGVRNFQVTDTSGFSLSDYFSLRIITSLLMGLATVLFVGYKYLFGGYDIEKATVVLVICLIYTLESFEDLFLGYYQTKGRLDVASKVFIIRWLAVFGSFILCISVSRDLAISISVAFLVSIIMEMVLLHDANSIVKVKINKLQFKATRIIASQCFPLFAFAFLTFYVTNAPKYSIDVIMTNKDQAVFGILAMPVFLIELLNNFIYQPQMVSLAGEWKNNDFQAFCVRIKKQFAYILLLTLFCCICSYLVGNRLLTLIFSVDVNAYRSELLILMLAGGMMAVMGYTSVVITVFRKQRVLLIGMLVISIMAFVGFNLIIQSYGIMGASIYYSILFGLMSLFNIVYIIVHINHEKRRIAA